MFGKYILYLKSVYKIASYLEVRCVHKVSVLVLAEDGDDGRPAAAHVLLGVEHFALARLNEGLRLQPSCQASSTCARGALHQVAQKLPFYGLVTANRCKIQV